MQTMISRAIAVAVWFLVPLGAARAKPPEWLKPIIAEDVTALSRGKVAVRLLDSGDVRHLPENRVRRVYRGAVRVLTEQGRKYAECAHHFNANTEKVLAARAWLVTPDGKGAKDYFMRDFTDAALRVGQVFWPQQRVLSYRATTETPVGGVFAWEFETESQAGISDINWRFPSDLPTVVSVLEVTPVSGGSLTWHGTGGAKVQPVPGSAPGALRWERRRYQPAPSAGERPDGFLPAAHFLSVRAHAADGSALIQTWTDLARIAAEVIEPRTVASAELKAKAEALVAGKTTRWERIRALTRFVQKEITYLAVVLDTDHLAGYRPNAAADVLQNRHGDCKDKATLLVTMLRAIGESGHVMLVHAGNPRAIDPAWPSARFNHAIAAIPAGEAVPADWPVVDVAPHGKLVLFDATDAYTPLGTLSAGDQGGFGLLAAKEANGLVRLPTASAATNAVEMRVTATLDAQGDLIAKVAEVSTGSSGVTQHAVRERLRSERFTPVLEARLRETVSYLQALTWKDAWEPEAARWRLDYEFKAPRFARRIGGALMLVSPQVVMANTRLTPWKTKADGVAWTPASRQKKEVRLTLPEGAVVDEMPDDWSQEGGGAACRLRYVREGRDVVYECELTQNGGFLGTAEYETLRAFLQKVQEAERRPVVVKVAAAAP